MSPNNLVLHKGNKNISLLPSLQTLNTSCRHRHFHLQICRARSLFEWPWLTEISGIFYSQTPVVNGCLFYSVFDHASHNATGGGLEFIYTPSIPSRNLEKIYPHLLLPLFPADWIGAKIVILRKKLTTVWLIYVNESSHLRHLAISVVGIITDLSMQLKEV